MRTPAGSRAHRSDVARAQHAPLSCPDPGRRTARKYPALSPPIVARAPGVDKPSTLRFHPRPVSIRSPFAAHKTPAGESGGCPVSLVEPRGIELVQSEIGRSQNVSAGAAQRHITAGKGLRLIAFRCGRARRVSVRFNAVWIHFADFPQTFWGPFRDALRTAQRGSQSPQALL